LLRGSGADSAALDYDGRTALDLAQAAGHLHIVEALKQAAR